MTVDHNLRPGYTTAEDKRELLLATLAGWRFERRVLKQQQHRMNWRGAMVWYCYGPSKNYVNGPYASRREAVAYALELLGEGELAD